MEIGVKLKAARMKSKMTQEEVAEKINVTRQTISNWETEKAYPDIISVIELSDLYEESLDNLLKESPAMIEYLKESTNTVASNHKLLVAIVINIILMIIFIIFNGFIIQNNILIFLSCSIGILSTCMLFYQIIKKL